MLVLLLHALLVQRLTSSMRPWELSLKRRLLFWPLVSWDWERHWTGVGLSPAPLMLSWDGPAV